MDKKITPDGMAARTLAAVGIARAAGELQRRYFADRASIGTTFKGPQDYLTVADGAVEKLVLGHLKAAFPDDDVLGEETGGSRDPRALWVIDPIDGTANFANGIAHFCISIGFVAAGREEIGVIYDPMRDEMFLARRGFGATCNGRQMKVVTNGEMARAQVELGWSSRRTVESYTAIVERTVKSGASFRRAGSGALGIAYVADGRCDAYAELHINSWDCLAGLLMVREAGGRTNDFLGAGGLGDGAPVQVAGSAIYDAFSKVTGIV
ncbi:MAG: inositol monophosphatase [Proteobacteria bacterium]|nr:inositol monophosphatase [Pseudomonadota bacterium]